MTLTQDTYRVESTTSPRERSRNPNSVASSQDLRRAFAETINRVLRLHTWQPGWNGQDVEAPKPEAIRHAFSWVMQMYEDALATNGEWFTPHVAANADGDVMFEWWNGDRDTGLVIYVSERTATYILDWGTNMETEMEDGEAMTSASRRRLWARLAG